MITEQATVTRCYDGKVEVRLDRQSACGGCELNRGCGIGVLGRMLGKSDRPLLLDTDRRFKPGDRLQLRISEAALVRASLMVYGLPLVGGLGAALAAALAGLSDPYVVALSMAGFYVGLKTAARRARRLENSSVMPYIIDIHLNPAAPAQSDNPMQSTGTCR